MTLPKTARSENVKVALAVLRSRVGDRALDEIVFDPEQHGEIFPTTWDELLDLNLIETLNGKYLLTGRGWTASLLTKGELYQASFKERLGRLLSALKSLVKGREELTYVSMRVLVEKTGLPEGWVFNMIEGKYVEEVLKRRGAAWAKPGRLILIPVGFGIESTDLNTLLQDEMLKKVEDLEDELDATRENLSRYRCPYCDAEVTSTGSYPLDEHNDGDYDDFACGFSLQDGRPRGLCPKDPDYPQLEDFELRMEQSESGQWMCYPIGKTPKAKLVEIGSCPGRTPEEAKERVSKRYAYVSGKNSDLSQAIW